MIGKIWRGSKKVLTYALALVMVVGAMQMVPMVRAAGDTITIAPMSYNITTGKMTYTVATTAAEKKIKYYVLQTSGNQNDEEMFRNATEVTENDGKSKDVEVGYNEYIYAWFTDQTGRVFARYDYRTLTDSSIQFTPTGSLIDWSSNPPSYDEAKGTIKFPAIASDSNIQVKYMVYFNGGQGGNFSSDECQAGEASVLQHLSKGTGNYEFHIWAEESGKRSRTYVINVAYNESTKPALSKVKNVYWVQGKPGTIAFTAPDDISNVGGYSLQMYSPGFVYATKKIENSAGGEIQVDMSGHMVQGNRTYTVGIRVLSKNTQYTNSEEVISGVYDPAQASAKVADGIQTALQGINNITLPTGNSTEDIIKQIANSATINDNDKKTVANTLTSKLKEQSADSLRMAMLANKDMVNLVEAIESLTTVQTTTTVGSNVAQDIFGGSTPAIKVVGAKLNATNESTPELKLNKAAATNLNLDEKYNKNNMVPLEINLTGCGDSGTALAIPVSITMPVPASINNKDKLVILHMNGNNVGEILYPRYVGNDLSFTVTHFSTFVFAEDSSIESTGGSGGSGSSGGGGGGGRADAAVEALITVAEAGATIKTKDITTLANSTMKALLKRGDITLVMEYTYKGVDYVVTIPAGKAVDNDIPWYGPLYLAGQYGNGINQSVTSGYIVKRGDTMSKIAKMSGMSLAELAKKNPQIKNLNRIRVGQSINR